MPRRAVLWVGALLLAGCANYEVISSSPTHVTYRFDASQVSLAQLADAATDYCEYAGGSPGGGLRAVPEDVEADGALRTVRFDCAGPPPTEDLQQDVDRLENAL